MPATAPTQARQLTAPPSRSTTSPASNTSSQTLDAACLTTHVSDGPPFRSECHLSRRRREDGRDGSSSFCESLRHTDPRQAQELAQRTPGGGMKLLLTSAG